MVFLIYTILCVLLFLTLLLICIENILDQVDVVGTDLVMDVVGTDLVMDVVGTAVVTAIYGILPCITIRIRSLIHVCVMTNRKKRVPPAVFFIIVHFDALRLFDFLRFTPYLVISLGRKDRTRSRANIVLH